MDRARPARGLRFRLARVPGGAVVITLHCACGRAIAYVCDDAAMRKHANVCAQCQEADRQLEEIDRRIVRKRAIDRGAVGHSPTPKAWDDACRKVLADDLGREPRADEWARFRRIRDAEADTRTHEDATDRWEVPDPSARDWAMVDDCEGFPAFV